MPSSYLAVIIVRWVQLLPQLVHSVLGAGGVREQLPPVCMRICSTLVAALMVCPQLQICAGQSLTCCASCNAVVDSQSCRVHAAQQPAGRLHELLRDVVQHARLQRPHPEHVVDGQLPEVAGRPRPIRGKRGFEKRELPCTEGFLLHMTRVAAHVLLQADGFVAGTTTASADVDQAHQSQLVRHIDALQTVSTAQQSHS